MSRPPPLRGIIPPLFKHLRCMSVALHSASYLFPPERTLGTVVSNTQHLLSTHHAHWPDCMCSYFCQSVLSLSLSLSLSLYSLCGSCHSQADAAPRWVR